MRSNGLTAALPHSNFPMCCSTTLGSFHGLSILDAVLPQEKPQEAVTSTLGGHLGCEGKRFDSIAEEGAFEVACNFGCCPGLS